MGIKRTKPSRPTASERCSMCVNDFFQFCAVAVHATAGSLFVPARESSGLASEHGLTFSACNRSISVQTGPGKSFLLLRCGTVKNKSNKKSRKNNDRNDDDTNFKSCCRFAGVQIVVTAQRGGWGEKARVLSFSSSPSLTFFISSSPPPPFRVTFHYLNAWDRLITDILNHLKDR